MSRLSEMAAKALSPKKAAQLEHSETVLAELRAAEKYKADVAGKIAAQEVRIQAADDASLTVAASEDATAETLAAAIDKLKSETAALEPLRLQERAAAQRLAAAQHAVTLNGNRVAIDAIERKGKARLELAKEYQELFGKLNKVRLNLYRVSGDLAMAWPGGVYRLPGGALCDVGELTAAIRAEMGRQTQDDKVPAPGAQLEYINYGHSINPATYPSLVDRIVQANDYLVGVLKGEAAPAAPAPAAPQAPAPIVAPIATPSASSIPTAAQKNAADKARVEAEWLARQPK